MTAPVEPDLDLSDLLVPVPVPPDGAGRAVRSARRRHWLRRSAVAGAVATVVAVIGSVAIGHRENGDRTVRTASPTSSAALLPAADVERVLPGAIVDRVDGRDFHLLDGPELRMGSLEAEKGVMRSWTRRGEGARSGALAGSDLLVHAYLFQFRDEREATNYVSDFLGKLQSNGTDVRPFTAIPGAIELHSAGTTALPTYLSIAFARDRTVYLLDVNAAGAPPTEQLRELALRQAELARPGATSCPVSSPLTGSGDGLPQEGSTTLGHVLQTVARYEPTIRSDFGGVLSLTAEPRNGEVWTGTNGGAFTVHRVKDFWIVVHLEGSTFCPSAPAAFHSYDGVPLHFVVG